MAPVALSPKNLIPKSLIPKNLVPKNLIPKNLIFLILTLNILIIHTSTSLCAPLPIPSSGLSVTSKLESLYKTVLNPTTCPLDFASHLRVRCGLSAGGVSGVQLQERNHIAQEHNDDDDNDEVPYKTTARDGTTRSDGTPNDGENITRRSVLAKMKKAFKSAAHTIKSHLSQISKLAFSSLSSAQLLLSHIAKYVPVVGGGLSAALKSESTALSLASSAIHADMTGKYALGMKVVKAVGDPVGFGMDMAEKGVRKAVGASGHR